MASVKSENIVLSINGLTKRYGKLTALDNLSVELDYGIYGLLGANGAGKSTFLNLLTDNIERSAGSILFHGKEIKTLGKKYREKIGYTPQVRGMYEDFTALEFLYYIGSLKGLKRREIKEQSKRFLEIVNLYSVAHKKIGSFSGGMKQRVLIATAMLGNPEILILDEPTVGLDPKERIQLYNYITDLSRERVVILATHVAFDIEGIAKKVMMLNQGKLVCFDTPKKMLESLNGHVGEAIGTYEEMLDLKFKYMGGKISMEGPDFKLRVVGDRLPAEFRLVKDNLTLEDAYLWYLNESMEKEQIEKA